MRYIKKLVVVAIAVVVSVSGFSAIAEGIQNDSLKTEKIVAVAKKGANKFKKKNFKRNRKVRAELTEEEKAAKLEEFKAKLAENLASGKITQEKYEKILSSADSEKFKPFKSPGKERVKLTEEEKAAKLEEFKTKLAENLASGKITQEQYDKMLSSFDSEKKPQPFKRPVNGKGRHFKKHKIPKTTEEKVIKE